MRRTHTLLGAGVTAFAITGSALAATELQLDLNAIVARSLDSSGNQTSFGGLNHTGSIQLSSNDETQLAGVLIDGNPQGVTLGRLASLSGMIDLVDGTVMGGNFMVTLNNGDTFNADIMGGAGMVRFQAGEGFSIDGLLSATTFSSDTFADIDISRWFNNQPLPGSFITFAFDPDDSGVSENTSTDIFIVIPSPLAGGMASVGLAGLAVRRRRVV